MVTKEQAMNETLFHYGQCTKKIGKRGGITLNIVQWRKSGECKTWKTRPSEFRLPISFGLYKHSYINHENADLFHVDKDCPLN